MTNTKYRNWDRVLNAIYAQGIRDGLNGEGISPTFHDDVFESFLIDAGATLAQREDQDMRDRAAREYRDGVADGMLA